MSAPSLYPRLAEPRLVEALADTPVVLIHGPRQCGKTTLARIVGDARGYEYRTFDDDATLAGAREDPAGFVGDLPDRVILDEVQHAPEMFSALKLAVDRDRRPGRFILTGSANVLLIPRLADSLAGRIEIVRLHPLAQCELAGNRPSFLKSLINGEFASASCDRLGADLAKKIVAGGYPAALVRDSKRRRTTWYRNYVDTIMQRDVRDYSRIQSFDALPRLLGVASANTSGLLNVSDLAAPFEMSRPTVRDYLALLERVFLIDRLSPWHDNRVSRLVKSPKLHIGDTGVGCTLLAVDEVALAADRPLLGRLLETFVFQELRRQSAGHEADLRFSHFRTRSGAEVDIVIEHGSREIAGVEVKAAASVTRNDFRGLRMLREASGSRFRAGVVLYDGEHSVGFGDRMHAVPIRSLWEAR
jgi:predicted AAA+ superfamily ATPase